MEDHHDDDRMDAEEQPQEEEQQMDEDSDDEETQQMRQMRNVFFARFLRHVIAGDIGELGGGAGSNQELVTRLKTSGNLTSEAVEKAMLLIPRGEFVTEDMRDVAYVDSPQRFSKMGFNISAPHVYAICLDKLNIEPGNAVLDIGSGCGLLTVLAGYLAGPTGFAHGLDIHQHIVDFASSNLTKFQQRHPDINVGNVSFFNRNCFLPDVDETKYDRIHVGACCPESKLPALVDMLKPGGIIVTPYGDRLLKATKRANGELEEETLMNVMYSDLVLPSDAEIQKAQILARRAKAMRITVPASTFKHDLLSHGIGEDLSNLGPNDICFEFDDGIQINSNRKLLSARSEVFRALFSNGMLEQNAPKIKIPFQDSNAFKLIVQYCTTDQCDLFPLLSSGGSPDAASSDLCVSLLELANYYKLERLLAMCELHLFGLLDPDNAAQLLTIAERFEARQLRGAVLEYIYSNMKDVIQTSSFQALDKDIMNMILLESVQRFHGLV